MCLDADDTGRMVKASNCIKNKPRNGGYLGLGFRTADASVRVVLLSIRYHWFACYAASPSFNFCYLENGAHRVVRIELF